jgi:hypothetical protein
MRWRQHTLHYSLRIMLNKRINRETTIATVRLVSIAFPLPLQQQLNREIFDVNASKGKHKQYRNHLLESLYYLERHLPLQKPLSTAVISILYSKSCKLLIATISLVITLKQKLKMILSSLNSHSIMYLK